MSTWGEAIKLSIFGGSHTSVIGVSIDGLPKGQKISMDEVYEQMKRRAPGNDKAATARKEADIPEIICGMTEDGTLTGETLTAVIHNTNQKSGDYQSLRYTPRPGHADYAAYMKFGGLNDIRGGGHFSARLTAPLVFAGAVMRQLLEEQRIVIGSHVSSIGNVVDKTYYSATVSEGNLYRINREYFPVISAEAKKRMYELIEAKRLEGDSVGGTVKCYVVGLPVGLGSHMFGGIENVLSSIIFGIPAVKGIEFGAGFRAAGMTGSENNDPYYYEEKQVKTKTNHSGGVIGGMSSGMPLVFRVAFKPTPSISKEQDTVDLKLMTNTKISVGGRHDPCIVPRAAPVVEAAAAIAIYELMKREGRLKV